jgi:Holliday junction resolvase-like predicted endonuclease
MNQKHKIGKWGVKLAEEYLFASGFRFLDRNIPIINSASAYLLDHNEHRMNWRLDVIAIEGGVENANLEITWFENAIS